MQPRHVPAANGWQWITQGFGLFKASPVIWIALFLIYLLIGMGLSIVPVVGPVVLNLLAPVFIAGFMLGCRAIEMGEELEINHLFAGFKQNTAQLITVGGIYLAGIIILVGVVFMMMGGAALGGLFAGHGAEDAAAMADGRMLMGLLVMMALILPLIMAYWFAPTLVVFHDMKATDAMKLSFAACLSNLIPFTLYSLISIVLMLLAMIPLGLGLLVMIPTMTASLYTSYRDIFDIQLGAQAADEV
ncbi:MAG: hypothetical protein FGM62_09620 [Methylobacterium sp.]|nr:hypothetical protein [Methylobacterium sp.]